MSKTLLAALFAVILASAALAQTPPADPQKPPPPPPETTQTTPPQPEPETQTPPAPEPQPQPAQPPPQTLTSSPSAQAPAPPSVLSEAASGAYEQRRESLPAVNIYLPEGQASVRLRKLIRNVLFESQIDYEFVNGDISTFLRYKYYARNYTYRLGLFDSIEFPDLTSNSKKEFERVRGGLLLVGVPKNYNNRWFFLLQDDRLTFGDTDRPDNLKNNVYTKIGYQFGTQFDERMNAIVGEQRGRITPVLTAYREIGPQRTGLAAAITQSGKVASGDYTFTRFEAEGLHRFDVTSTMFVFSRLHLGTFLTHDEVVPVPRDVNGDDKIDELDIIPRWEFFDIPQAELFRLGGREALKSVKTSDDSIGSHELHVTNEFFVPIFRNREYKIWKLYWNTLYGVGYLGAGGVGFKANEVVKSKRAVVDAGLGTESAISFGEYDIYFNFIFVKQIKAPDEIRSRMFLFSIRTVR